MRFMLMIYDNPDTRDLFTGPEGRTSWRRSTPSWPG